MFIKCKHFGNASAIAGIEPLKTKFNQKQPSYVTRYENWINWEVILNRYFVYSQK